MRKVFDSSIPQTIQQRFFNYILSQRPLNFGVELVNTCNADCSFCAYRYQDREKGVMSDEIFKRAVDEYCKIGGGMLELTPTVGEPLLDKKIIERVRWARSRSEIKGVRFYTNLLLLHHFNIRDFATSGITDIGISTCLKDEATYRKIYRAEGYLQLLNNIRNLCEINVRLGSPCRIKLNLRVPKPFSEIYESRDYQEISRYFKKENIEISQHDFDSWSRRIKRNDLPDGQHFPDCLPLSEGPCSELYRRIQVLYDGTVNFCMCRDLNGEFTIGNIRQEGILEIWKGKQLRKYREDWVKGIYPSMCLTCERYQPVREMQSNRKIHIIKKYLRSLIP